MKYMKKAFTLMEITIGLLIISILALLCMPVINSQLEKSKEYSYYLAYKTVEKIASQILIYGDSENDTPEQSAYNVQSGRIWNKLIPSAYANFYSGDDAIKKYKSLFQDSPFMWPIEYISFGEHEWDLAKMCVNNPNGANNIGQNHFLAYSNADKLANSGKALYSGGKFCEDVFNIATYSCTKNGVTTDNCYKLMNNGEISKAVNKLRSDAEGDDNHKDSSGQHDHRMGYSASTQSAYYNRFERNYVYQRFFGAGQQFTEPFVMSNFPYLGNGNGLAPRNFGDNEDDFKNNRGSIIGWLRNSEASNVCQMLGTGTGLDSFYICSSNDNCQCTVIKQREQYDIDDEISKYAKGIIGGHSGIGSVQNLAPAACDDSYINAGGTWSTSDDNSMDYFPYDALHVNVYSHITSRCTCSGGVALNNPKVCCSGLNMYYDGSTCKSCAWNQTYDPASRSCVCADGFSASENDCSEIACPFGMHKSDTNTPDVCVPNLPFLSAQHLCERISQLYNTVDSHCRANDIIIANPVGFNRAAGNYLRRSTSFSSVPANITFSNGQRLWILSNKAASIPGLTYNPDTDSPRLSVCHLIKIDSAETSKTSEVNNNNTLCLGERVRGVSIMQLEGVPTQLRKKIDSKWFGDAAKCCATPNYDKNDSSLYAPEDTMHQNLDNSNPRVYAISGFTVFVDIDGESKGTNTLWDDIFPFYLSSDGKVFPGYPINNSMAAKRNIAGNSSWLQADVYYFDYSADDNHRRRVVLYRSIPMARAMCEARMVNSNAVYCQNLGNNFRRAADINVNGDSQHPCDAYQCYVKVKNKIKFL